MRLLFFYNSIFNNDINCIKTFCSRFERGRFFSYRLVFAILPWVKPRENASIEIKMLQTAWKQNISESFLASPIFRKNWVHNPVSPNSNCRLGHAPGLRNLLGALSPISKEKWRSIRSVWTGWRVKPELGEIIEGGERIKNSSKTGENAYFGLIEVSSCSMVMKLYQRCRFKTISGNIAFSRNILPNWTFLGKISADIPPELRL